jgi:hypothetical protein
MVAIPGSEPLKPLKEKINRMYAGVIRENAREFLIAYRSPEN